MNWNDLVFECVKDLCAERERKEFTLLEIYTYISEMKAFYPNNNHVKDKIRQQLQHLRDGGIIKFTNKPGNYVLENNE